MSKYEPASVIAARSILAGQCPPIAAIDYIPTAPLDGPGQTQRGQGLEFIWRPEDTRKHIDSQEPWQRSVEEGKAPKGSWPMQLACKRGNVRVLLELCSAAIDETLRFLRLLAESGYEENVLWSLPGLRGQSLHNRLVTACHLELSGLVSEYDRLVGLGVDTILRPDLETPAVYRALERAEAMA